MWFLPTRSRPDAVKELISAIESTGSAPDFAVMIDGNPEQYKDVPWPSNWKIHSSEEQLEVIGAVNALFKLYPNEKTYGFLTDHARPQSALWSEELEKAALRYGIALCDDGHNRINERTGYRRMTAASCFDGDLCRKLGYVWPDMFVHFYGDDVWEDIGHELGIIRWCEHVKVKDLLFSKGEIPIDINHHRVFKGKPYAKDDHDAYFQGWLPRKEEIINSLRKEIIICCVNKADYLGRGAEYVNKLFDMVARNISKKVAYRFVCFTDNGDGLEEAIDMRPLPKNVNGWWNKLYLFTQFNNDERVIYFDLDTVITGGLDEILRYNGEFAMLRDFYFPTQLASGVMLWRGGFGHDIWEKWNHCERPTPKGGDQEWIGKLYPNADVLQDLMPDHIRSYKIDCWDGIPKSCRIVCFHGLPRPHQVDGWVKYVWKIGGGTTPELEIVGNTHGEILAANIKYSVSRNYEKLKRVSAHKGHAVIVGGGPSLKEELDGIRKRQEHGQIIFATNNTYSYLMDNGIIPDYHVMIDARPQMAEFVPNIANCLYASQCDPSVFKRAEDRGNNIYIWHHNAFDIFNFIGKNSGDMIIAGGQSVGLKAIAIAHALGFREYHIYGMDSSYEGEKHHSYNQKLNDKENIIEVICDNVPFKCSPWMVTQVEQFKDLAQELIKENCLMTVHGNGLLPFVAQRL